MTPLETARSYIRRGWAPVPIPHRQKRPVLGGWQNLRIGEADALRYFDGQAQNVGVILGEPSGWLVDVDLDCAEAVRLAPYYLPATECVFGHESKPRSHRLYTSEVPRRVELVDPESGECLLELRSTGCQTVVPGSTHPSGERVEWDEDGDSAGVDPEALQAEVRKLGAACLLVRAAPAQDRHEYLLDVSGALVRGLGADGAAHLLHPVAREVLGGLYRRQDGERLIAGTARKVAAGDPATGWPKLAERIGEKRSRKLAEWLGVDRPEWAAEAGAAGVAEQPWPAPLAPEAFHGLAGEIVRTIEPHTEADPAALLFQLLAAVGNLLGAGSWIKVEGDRHPPRLFVVQVGRTSKGRKGTSWGRVREALEGAAGTWLASRVASGLSSGEGVIHEVRDEVTRTSKKGEVEVVDEGVADKRLLVVEGEFAKALRSMERHGNTLSAVLRDAWDRGELRSLTRTSPLRATGAHVSVIGHITADELRRYLDRTEAANGLANRFLFVCTQRSKLLPRGGGRIDWTGIEGRLRHTLAGASNIGEVGRTDAAWAIWEAVYPELSADRPGLLGAVLGRAEAQVLRLALVYALLDRQAFVDAPHLHAALACWAYAEASARHVFADILGDPTADEILRLLRGAPEGVTRNGIMDHFGRNRSSNEIARALAMLARDNLAVRETVPTGGRPAERWRARA